MKQALVACLKASYVADKRVPTCCRFGEAGMAACRQEKRSWIRDWYLTLFSESQMTFYLSFIALGAMDGREGWVDLCLAEKHDVSTSCAE